MKRLFSTGLIVIATLLAPAIYADEHDSGESRATTYVKDSAITAKVKAKLAADYPTSMTRIKVDTDNQGVVWLSGVAKNQDEANKAVSAAQDTEGVKEVKNNIKIEGE